MTMSHPPALRTEIEFTLPKGYLDETGVLHRRGIMRLATAADEILPLRDPRVQQNPAYLAIIVLSRVIVSLGDVAQVDTRVVEGLFAADLDYLQRLYEELNSADETDAPPGAPGTAGRRDRGGFGVLGEA